jgi:ankyrin repeat protein
MLWEQVTKVAFALLVSAMSLIAAGSDASLVDAAQGGDGAGVRALLDQGADVNARQADGMTALHWAAYQDDLKTVEALVRAGADVNAVNRYGVTPLSMACANGDGRMVELLLESGADPNHALAGDETVLMIAARTGQLAAVKALLARRVDVNAKETERGQTALMWAAAEGHTAVVEALLDAGADLHERLDSGFTPLLFAVREGRIGVVRALLRAGADPNEAIDSERLPRGGRPRSGVSALLLAVKNAHFELASLLLDAGADPNADATGYTPLHAVASVRKPGIGDNDPPPQGSGNMTSIEFVRKIAAAGANLDARMTRNVNLGNTMLNKSGATPFFLAAQSADAELMRTLAELGADPMLANEDDSTPLMAAAGLGTRSPGEDAGTEEEVLEAVQAALDLGNDIDAVDKHGETAMHGAAYKNLPKVVGMLAEKGARIDVWNRKNEYGWTPLTIAQGIRFGNFKPSPPTVAAILQVMAAAGVSPPVNAEPPKPREIY